MQVESRLSDTLDDLRAIRAGLEAGDPIEVVESEKLMARIQELVPMVSQSDVAVLKAEVDAVIILVTEQKRALSDELKRLNKGRKGLGGYNHIRGYDTEQRLSRTA